MEYNSGFKGLKTS